MKSFTVIFSPYALDDMEQPVNYYEERKTGSGKRFTEEFRTNT